MTDIAISARAGSASRTAHSLAIGGRRFDLTLWGDGGDGTWHWMITAPGVLALSGEAATERQALDDAHRAGSTLASLVVA